MAKVKAKSAKDILAEYSAEREYELHPTGVGVIDDLWGGGMDPQGFYALWGPQGSGKTTLLMQFFKKKLSQGIPCTFIDVEKAFNKMQQESYGLLQYVESGLLTVLTCENYEQLEYIMEAVAETECGLLGIDSETMIQPSVERDLRVTDNQPGLKAKQSAFVIFKMKPIFFKKKCPIVMLFHARANISMTGGTQDEIKQAGGYAALHAPDVITKVMAGAKVYESDSKSPQIGQIIRIVTQKNKYTAPFVSVEKKLIYGKGISAKIDLIDRALAAGVIQTGGAGYYTLPNGEKVRGTKALYEVSNDVLKSIKETLQSQ